MAQLLGIFKASDYIRLRKYMVCAVKVWPGCVLEQKLGVSWLSRWLEEGDRVDSGLHVSIPGNEHLIPLWLSLVTSRISLEASGSSTGLSSVGIQDR